jgi:large subunit ribosomal protein L2
LSSGVKKVFSAFSLASEGSANLHILKNQWMNTKSGFWRQKGFKPKVRGVAKNPVDHPHGGRTKAIRYPRTPWGKTTKFK